MMDRAHIPLQSGIRLITANTQESDPQVIIYGLLLHYG
jgi:hypothetical protein